MLLIVVDPPSRARVLESSTMHPTEVHPEGIAVAVATGVVLVAVPVA
jgi:hypothetical protein